MSLVSASAFPPPLCCSVPGSHLGSDLVSDLASDLASRLIFYIGSGPDSDLGSGASRSEEGCESPRAVEHVPCEGDTDGSEKKTRRRGKRTRSGVEGHSTAEVRTECEGGCSRQCVSAAAQD
eukprot:1794733-Rhodomonas_salina.1